MRAPARAIAAAALLLLSAGAAQALEAGAAKVEITPPLGTPLNGYFDRLGRGALSVHDPVWVRCVYLHDGETGVFLLTADLCIINRELRDRVIELAPDVVPKENIILTATHTHSAQGGMVKSMLFRSVSGRFMPEVLELTAQRFAEAMQLAYDARKRGAIGYGVANQEVLSRNRRVPGGPYDSQIGVVRVDDSDGNAIAILANFAAHPTSVPLDGPDALAVSADYCGFYYNAIEEMASPGCVAMFMNGAEGNQTCANPEDLSGWARVESIGRLLAVRVKEVANSITCGDATLHVGYATPELPLTLSSSILPSSTVLHTLEINDLLMTFVPGEPCVEIGLELRRRALAAGYGIQMTVGLSDDHLMYFVPRSLYHTLAYESGMTFYGPGIEDWFYREFSRLSTKGAPEAERQGPENPTVEHSGGAARLVAQGSPYAIGYARGAAFKETLRGRFEERIVARCRDGELIPESGLWKAAPSFMDLTPLALPRLGIGARPLLTGLAPGPFAELEGVADGAGMPFDAVWLLQCEPVFAARGSLEERYRSAFCTMFAVVGEKAGAEDILVGRNLDWPDEEPPVILEARPDGGHSFVQVGFEWNVGAFTGMNDAGVTVCVERVLGLGDPSIECPPVEMILRTILEQAGTLEDALTLLASYPLRGYSVLLASPEGARVVELGRERTIREPQDDLLLGVVPESAHADDEARTRYARIGALLAEERIVAADEATAFLRDSDLSAPEKGRVYNNHTRHSVVFEPTARALHVTFDAAAEPIRVTVKAGAGS